MNEKYEKIINLPHHVSTKHAPMPISDRAAQFAPYAALSGYEDAVEETARLTDQKHELDEHEKEKINLVLTALLSANDGKKAKITFFRPDSKKAGGAYVTVIGEIGRFDEIRREIILLGGKKIAIDDVVEIKNVGF
jgi:hypothetical protein